MSTTVQAQPAERLTVAQIIESARAEREAAEREGEKLAAIERQNTYARMRADLAAALKQNLGLVVDESQITIFEDDEPDAGDCPLIEVDGFTFAIRQPNRYYHWGEWSLRALCIECECAKGCRLPLWLQVSTPYDLEIIVGDRAAQTHEWCLQKMPKLPPTVRTEERAIGDVLAAAEVYAQAVSTVQALEDERPLIKAKAIGEMIGTPNPLGKPGAVHSGSSAEAVVEEHALYWQHRQKQNAAEVERHRAEAALFAAKQHARLAVATVHRGDDE